MEEDERPEIERRAAPRAAVRTEVRIYYPDLHRLADEICRDISVGGMFVESAAPPAIGTEIRFEIHLPTKQLLVVDGEGVVVWVHPNSNDPLRPNGFGVKFQQLDPRFRNLIFRVVDRHIQRGGNPFDLDLELEPG